MIEVQLVFEFGLDAEIDLRECPPSIDLVAPDGLRISLWLPEGHFTDAGTRPEDDRRFSLGGHIGSWFGDRSGHSVSVFAVTVEHSLDVSEEAATGTSDELQSAVDAAFAQHEERAVTVARCFVDQARTYGKQFLLGPLDSHHVTSTRVHRAGRPLRVGGGSAFRVPATTSGYRLPGAEARLLFERAVAGEQAPLHRMVLADARRSESLPYQVLLAAVAVETAVRSILVAASGEIKPLVDLLMSNSREFAAAAVKLLDSPCAVVLGESLKESDRACWNLVSDLFEDRNHVAHGRIDRLRGLDVLRIEIDAAERTLDWLEARAASVLARRSSE